MKFEFHPDFKFLAAAKIVWPKLKGLFSGFEFKVGEYRSMMKKVLRILFFLLALVAIAILAIWLIRRS